MLKIAQAFASQVIDSALANDYREYSNIYHTYIILAQRAHQLFIIQAAISSLRTKSRVRAMEPAVARIEVVRLYRTLLRAGRKLRLTDQV